MDDWRAEGLTVVAGGKTLVDGVSFRLKRGELIVLLGPNGAGKTTLIHAALGMKPAASGRSWFGEDDAAQLAPQARAQRASYLPQRRPLAWPQRVRDVVALGRYSHGVTLGRLSARDAAAVDRALAKADLTHLADRSASTLSGGEMARVHCARALASEAPLLVADEPTAALDPRHQHQIMAVMDAYVKAGGGALVVVHDVALAARYATRLLWMKDGALLADGAPEDTLSADRLADLYGVRATVDQRQVIIHGAL